MALSTSPEEDSVDEAPSALVACMFGSYSSILVGVVGETDEVGHVEFEYTTCWAASRAMLRMRFWWRGVPRFGKNRDWASGLVWLGNRSVRCRCSGLDGSLRDYLDWILGVGFWRVREVFLDDSFKARQSVVVDSKLPIKVEARAFDVDVAALMALFETISTGYEE